MANPFDQFDTGNPFDQFDAAAMANPFDQFDEGPTATLDVRPPVSAPAYLGEGGAPLTPDETKALETREPPRKRSALERVVAAPLQKGPVLGAAEVVDALPDLVSEGLIAAGMDKTQANKLGRDVRAGIQSLGPLGFEFTGLAALPGASTLKAARSLPDDVIPPLGGGARTGEEALPAFAIPGNPGIAGQPRVAFADTPRSTYIDDIADGVIATPSADEIGNVLKGVRDADRKWSNHLGLSDDEYARLRRLNREIDGGSDRAMRDKEALLSKLKDDARDLDIPDEGELQQLLSEFRSLQRSGDESIEEYADGIARVLKRYVGGYIDRTPFARAVFRKAFDQARSNGIDTKKLGNDVINRHLGDLSPSDRAFMEQEFRAFTRPKLEAPTATTTTTAETTGVPKVETITEGPVRAGNINLDRIYAPDDVKQVIRETADANQEFIQARRGVITQDETREMASLLGMTPEKLATRAKGQAFNAEEMFAARELLVQQATQVRNLARVAQGGSDADKLKFSEAITRLATIQEQVSGATAEAGRALQQFRMLAGADKATVARILEAAKAGGLDKIIDGVHAMDNAPIESIANFVANATKSKFSDKVLEVWINALLSGPQTHATNILSNTLVSLWSIPETAIAAGISKVTGSGIKGREVIERAFGFVEGAREGLRAAGRTFRTGEPSDLASKLDARKFRAIGGTTGEVVRVPGRALMAEDEFFKAIGYRQEINTLALRQAVNEGHRGRALAGRVAEIKANPTDEMMTAARKVAEKQTFTNPLGDVGSKILGITRAVPAFRVIAPFIRTPTNIVKFFVERTPLGVLSKEVRANLSGKNGAVARDTQIARIGLGSAVGAATVYSVLEGNVTGSGPVDPKKRALLYKSGWQPYSIKIGDSYYSYSRLEPLGMLLGVSADFAELSDKMNEDEKQNVASLIAGSVAKNLTSKTWLRGVSEAIEAYQDPDRYGAQWVRNLAGTVVPTAVAQIARSRDPYLREANSVLDKIKERIPGWRESLPMRRDVFGEPIKLEGSLGPDMLSPIYQSAAKDDPVIDAMIKAKVAPGRPSRQIRGVELEPAEYDMLQEVTGRTIRKGLEQVIKAPQWSKLPQESKADLIEGVINRARDVGRATVVSRFPDLTMRIAQELQRTQTP